MRLVALLLALTPVFAQDDNAGAKSRFSMRPFATAADWEQRRAFLQRQILASAGLLPAPPKGDLQAQYYETIDRGTYTIAVVTLETFPGLRVAGNLYRPKRPGRHPAVTLAHGHWKHGRVHHDDDYSVPALAMGLAAQGFVVFAHDMVGYNDTRRLPHSFGGAPEQQWLFGPLGMQLWNSIRAVDFLVSLADVDPARIAATGTSGGATQTLLLAAVDDRVAVSAPAGMVSATFQGDDACEEAPFLRAGTSNLEFAAMVAPRPQLIVSATHDWTRRATEEALPAIGGVYRLYAAEDALREVKIDAGHNCNAGCRAAVGGFLGQHLLEGPAPYVDGVMDIAPQRLLAGISEPEQTGEIFRAWRSMALQQAGAAVRDELRTVWRATLGMPAEMAVTASPQGGELQLRMAGAEEVVRTEWQPGRGAGHAGVVLAASEGGFSGARALAAPWASDGLEMLLVEPDGGSVPIVRRGDHLVYHWHADARRVRDLTIALQYARDTWAGPVHLVCDGKAASWCLAAAAAVPFPVNLHVPERDRKKLGMALAMPGLQRLGGVAALYRLVLEWPEVVSDF